MFVRIMIAGIVVFAATGAAHAQSINGNWTCTIKGGTTGSYTQAICVAGNAAHVDSGPAFPITMNGAEARFDRIADGQTQNYTLTAAGMQLSVYITGRRTKTSAGRGEGARDTWGRRHL